SGVRLQIRDVATGTTLAGQVVLELRGPCFTFHPTAPLFTGLNPDKVLTLFSSETGEPIRSLDFALGKRVTCVAFAPDGLTCAVGGSNRQFAVFDVECEAAPSRSRLAGKTLRAPRRWRA